MLTQLRYNKQQLSLLQSLMLAIEGRPAVLLHTSVFAIEPDLSRARDRSEAVVPADTGLERLRPVLAGTEQQATAVKLLTNLAILPTGRVDSLQHLKFTIRAADLHE